VIAGAKDGAPRADLKKPWTAVCRAFEGGERQGTSLKIRSLDADRMALPATKTVVLEIQHAVGSQKKWSSYYGPLPHPAENHPDKSHRVQPLPLPPTQSYRTLLQQDQALRRIATRYDKLGGNSSRLSNSSLFAYASPL
jgi:hypothetical protein